MCSRRTSVCSRRTSGVLKEDVSVLKQDVGVLKQDVSVLKEDVSVLKRRHGRDQGPPRPARTVDAGGVRPDGRQVRTAHRADRAGRAACRGRAGHGPPVSQVAGASRMARTTDPAAPTTVADGPSTDARTVTGAHWAVSTRSEISRADRAGEPGGQRRVDAAEHDRVHVEQVHHGRGGHAERRCRPPPARPGRPGRRPWPGRRGGPPRRRRRARRRRPAARSSASWLAYASRQPRAPHRHRGPSGRIVTWPSSPPKPRAPRNSRPSSTMPGADADLAGDVEEARPLGRRVGLGPALSSPSAARFASFSTVTESQRRQASAGRASASIDRTSTSCQSRLGASRTTPSATRPGHGQRGPGDAQALGRRRGDRGRGEIGEVGQDLGSAARPRRSARASSVVAHRAGQVDHAGGEVVDVDLQAQPGRAVRGQSQPDRRAAGAAAGRRVDLDQQAPASSSSTRVETVALVNPVAAATSARETGCGHAATWRSTRPRLWVRRLRCRTGASRSAAGAAGRGAGRRPWP